MNNTKIPIGVVVKSTGGLNFGQTVEIIDDSLYNLYVVRPHGDKNILFIEKNLIQKSEEQYSYSTGPCKLNPRYEN